MNKSELRTVSLARQKSISLDQRQRDSSQIARQFFANFSLDSINTLHCFLPIERFREIDTTLIIHQLWKEHPQVRTVVPRVDFETGEIESVHYTADSEIGENRWLISEPVGGEPVVTTSIDMVLVPGVCFDLQGNRVGYGKGFYDRFLRRCRPDCLKVGLSYFAPLEKIDDVHDGDVRVDFVITPYRVQKS